MHYNLQKPQDLIKLERKKNLLQAKILAKQLEDKECELHNSLSSSMQKVLNGKKLLLWKQLLIKCGYDDLAVCEFMFRGVPLVGSHDTPKCYPELLKPATLTEEDLQSSAVWRRRELFYRGFINLIQDTLTIFLRLLRRNWSLDFWKALFTANKRSQNFWAETIGRSSEDSYLFRGQRWNSGRLMIVLRLSWTVHILRPRILSFKMWTTLQALHWGCLQRCMVGHSFLDLVSG